MTALEELIEQYKRKVKALNDLYRQASSDAERKRLSEKVGCYRAFLTDLKRAKADSVGLSSDVSDSLPSAVN